MKKTISITLAVAALVLCFAFQASALQIKTATVYSTSTNTVEGDGAQCIVLNVVDEQHFRVYTSATAAAGGASTAGVMIDHPTVTNSTMNAATNTVGSTWKSAVLCTPTAVTYEDWFRLPNSTYKIRLRSTTAGETNSVVLVAY